MSRLCWNLRDSLQCVVVPTAHSTLIKNDQPAAVISHSEQCVVTVSSFQGHPKERKFNMFLKRRGGRFGGKSKENAEVQVRDGGLVR